MRDFYWRKPLARQVYLFAKLARGKKIRSRLEFARQCIVIPEGPHRLEHWRPEFQPYCSVVLDLMDRSPQRKYRFSGCVQSGKSFVGVICVLWHLLERGEDVGYAVPDIDQSARDKWQKEFLPVIMASPELSQYMPTRGEGTQGGTPSSIKFLNGATLRFISGTGKDHHRSNFTVNVVFKTEVDRYDTAGEVSRESSPPEQIDNRTKAYQATQQDYSYEECTVTAEDGRIWLEILESTNHKLHAECVHCHSLVCPNREDFHGVTEATDVEEAKQLGHFRCPSCNGKWTEQQRQDMLRNLTPIGEGQQAAIGTDGCALIEGDLKPTNRLGFTWNAFHNCFWSTEDIAEEEWLALYGRNAEDKDLERRQHAWTLPSEADVFVVTPLSVRDILERSAAKDAAADAWERSIPLRYAPPNTIGITAGVDVGKRWLHFVVRAFYETPSGINARVIDLGELPVRTDEIGIKRALPEAIALLDERFAPGYAVWQNDAAPRLPVELRGIDGGWQGDEVGRRKEYLVWKALLNFAEQNRDGWIMTLGRGQSEPPGKGSYVHPKSLSSSKTKNAVVWIGEQLHIRYSAKFRKQFIDAGADPQFAGSYCIINVDEHKEVLRTGYGDTPVGEDGAMLSFNAQTKAERDLLTTYGKQIIAENRKQKHVVGRGPVVVFDNTGRRKNHFGDADVIAVAMAGVLELPINVMPEVVAAQPSKSESAPLRTPGGQSFLATQR